MLYKIKRNEEKINFKLQNTYQKEENPSIKVDWDVLKEFHVVCYHENTYKIQN